MCFPQLLDIDPFRVHREIVLENSGEGIDHGLLFCVGHWKKVAGIQDAFWELCDVSEDRNGR